MIKPLQFEECSNLQATESDIQKAEKLYASKFPPVLKEFCITYNGGYPAPENRFYIVPKHFKEYHDEYRRLSSGVVCDFLLGIGSNLSGCDLITVKANFDEFNERIIPIAEDLGGNYVVIKADENDEAVYWRENGLYDEEGLPVLLKIADNLQDFLNALSSDPLEK